VKRKKKPDANADRLLKGRVVLPEVYDRLDETGRPVNVICSVLQDSSVEEVIDFLSKVRIKVSEEREVHTDYYVFATLANAKDAEKIEKAKKRLIGHVWLDKEMGRCVESSQKTINAPAARQLFESEGKGIHWAVLDTGIDITHSWFTQHGNCDPSRQKDFTGEGKGPADSHGTHVAGIIAKIAPKVTLYDYKVIGKEGGYASWIIRAMHDIRKINFEAGRTVIHGVNMSLGGPVPVGSYGCGWSPECQEATRLMASGVVVCAAAGNDGHKDLATVRHGELKIFSTYVDVGITDPGNAEEIITVGSTHKVYPHTYGPSYFSSKGPTGDGRYKPDCLAPGEKIVSAEAGTGNGTIEMDGTSMATPHVSGAIAIFLSIKPEFKGRAREVKQILLNSCTDLHRDRLFQGSGLVDVLRMVQSV
jgi:subtilisin family serine protease